MANLLTTTIDGSITEKNADATSPIITSSFPIRSANTTYTSNTVTDSTAAYNITSGKVVIAYRDTSDSSYGKAVVGTVTGDTIAFGTPVNFSDTTAVSTAGISMATLPGSSKVVIAWSEGSSTVSNAANKGTSRVGTISGTTISFGAESTFESSGYGLTQENGWNKMMVSDTTNNRVILAWYGGNNSARQGMVSCGTVSGTTLTWGTTQSWATTHAFQYQSMVYDATADKFVIAWENYESGAHNGKHVVGTIGPTPNHITFGTVVVDAAYSWDAHAMTYSAAHGKIVHIFRKYGISPTLATGFARVGTISGTTVTWGVESTFPLTSTNDMYDPNIIYHADKSKFMIIYSGSNREIYGVAGTITGTIEDPTISLSTRILINDDNSGGGSTADPGLAYDTVRKRIVLSTNSSSGSAFGPGTKGEILHFDGANLTVDLATGNFFEVDLEDLTQQPASFTISNSSSTHVSSFILKITQSYEPKDFVWSELTAFKWIGGTAPTLSTGNDKIDILSFTTYDNGTTWHGSVVGQNNPDATTPSNLFGERGVLGGSDTNSGTPTFSGLIEYINISTLANVDGTTFGNLTVGREGTAATSDASRGVWAGGWKFAATAASVDTMDYITIATPGNATDFGNLTVARSRLHAGTSNGSRGVFFGGIPVGGTHSNTIDYITIATTGNATDFGDLIVATKKGAAAGDDVRGLFGSGQDSASSGADTKNVVYITIATTGNATDFGDLVIAEAYRAACSDGSRAVWAGGGGQTTSIEYVTISTISNAVTFGHLITARRYLAATSNGSRGVFLGGIGGSNIIDYITISTPSNSSRFGDLSRPRNHGSATSGN
jgi:hypothetical protein